MIKFLKKGENLNFRFMCPSCGKPIIMTLKCTILYDESTGETYIVHQDCYHDFLKQKGDRFSSCDFYWFFKNLCQGFGDIVSKF